MVERLESERVFQDTKVTQGTYKRISEIIYKGQMDSAIRRSFTLLGEVKGKRLLELGCGMGQFTIELAKRGADVHAIDISDESVQYVAKKAADTGVPLKVMVMNAEKMLFPADYFDLVYGGAILHHLDLPKALSEIRRVLKVGGRAVFVEPLGTNPIINLYRKVTPHLRTKDEHPIKPSDLDMMRVEFGKVEVQPFYLTTILATVLRFVLGEADVTKWLFSRFETLDNIVLDRLRWSWIWCRTIVLAFDKPQKSG